MDIREPRTPSELAQSAQLQADLFQAAGPLTGATSPKFQFAWHGDHLHGCIFWQPTADGGALIAPPTVWGNLRRQALRTGRALFSAAVSDCYQHQRQFALCLVETTDQFAQQIVSIGEAITHVSDVLTLERAIAPREPPGAPPPPRETAIHFAHHTRKRFLTTFIASQTKSRDCPALAALRTPEQAFATFEAEQGPPNVQGFLWRWSDKDAGVLFLKQTTDSSLEISYLGVIPEMRRQGLARAMLSQALHLSQSNHLSKIRVLVDVQNSPARALYETAQFVETARFSLFFIAQSS